MINYQLPQFQRIFSAKIFKMTLKAISWGLLIAFISFNVIFPKSDNPEVSGKIRAILLKPLSSSNHLALATILQKIGFQAAAKNELGLSLDLWNQNKSSENVLGASTDPNDIKLAWEANNQNLTKNYDYWKSIVLEKPEYRDGLIMLGVYAYQISRESEAKNAWKQAIAIDPNYELSGVLLRLINQQD